MAVIILLGILGATAVGKSQKLSGAARSAVVQNLAASIQSASTLNAMSFYASPCFTFHGNGIGSVNTVSIHYRQVYSGDWEPRFTADCIYQSDAALDGIPEILEAINMPEETLNNYWILHNRQDPVPLSDALWVAPFPPKDKKGVRLVSFTNPASQTQVNELISTNCYVKYATPHSNFNTAKAEAVTTGC